MIWSSPVELPPLVLASGSRYRAQMLAEAGLVAEIDPPEVDERALDHLFAELGPEGFAFDLARRKAAVVAARHPGALVLAGDQVGVLDTAAGAMQLTKQGDVDSAVRQLAAMSGTTHTLVNALVVAGPRHGALIEGIDVQLVTMRRFTHDEAGDYVRRFEPFDSSGSYRLEDQATMAPLEPFVVQVEGEHDSGVLGLPLPLLFRLLEQVTRAQR